MATATRRAGRLWQRPRAPGGERKRQRQRRSPQAGDPGSLAMVPKYSMVGPFRGHMSIKSSPAVDSSAPKSLHTSVKYQDQQKKERPVKAVEKYEKELVQILSASPFNCRSVSTRQQKWPHKSGRCLAPSGNVCSMAEGEEHSHLPSQRPCSGIPSPVLTAGETVRDTVQQALAQTPVHKPNVLKRSTRPHSQASLRAVVCRRKKTFQDLQNKTYSGDLLDKHSDWFTAQKKAFAPQILKTSRQSFLSAYRYYSPPHKMKSTSPGQPSLKSTGTYHVRPRVLCSCVEEDPHLRSDPDYSMWHSVEVIASKLAHELQFMKPQTPHSLRSQLQKKEEELKYLQFLQDVTNYILISCCFHQEAIDGIFQMHIRSRRHDLDEV